MWHMRVVVGARRSVAMMRRMARWGATLVLLACAMACAQSRSQLVGLTLAAAVPWLGAIRSLLQPGTRCPRGLVFAVAAALHLLPLCTPLVLSDDVYRYLWDARVARAGGDSYAYAPSDPAVAPLRDRTHGRINHPGVRTIYPPVAQLWFRAIDAFAHHPLAFRFAAVAANLLAFTLLGRLLRARGRDPRLAIVYGWSPVAAVEAAVGAHVDTAAIALLLAGLWAYECRRTVAAGALLGLSFGIKLAAMPLALLAGRRRPWLIACFFAVAIATLFPRLVGSGPLLPGLPDYLTRWRFNPSLFAALEQAVAAATRLPPEGVSLTARGLVAGLWLGLCVSLFWRAADPVTAGRWLTVAALLLSPTVHPWYALWVLALCADRPNFATLTLVSLLPLSYWGESLPLRAIEYGLPALVLGVELLRRSRIL